MIIGLICALLPFWCCAIVAATNNKYQNRCDRFERADKQAAEQACRQAQLRGNRTDYDAQRQTGGNLPDQADAADRMK